MAKVLMKGQGKELFEKIRKGDKKSIATLMGANLDLVKKIARKYKKNNHYLTYEVLIEIGKSGLRKAMDKYNHGKGYKFSTYASWWIRQAIHMALGIEGK